MSQYTTHRFYRVAHPPLPCRASPPQGGRSTKSNPIAQQHTSYVSEITGSLLKTSGSAYPISLLVGEMAGKPEGG
ncbi:hypothetical protein E6C51_04010 [Allorhizobium terrae]|uniref:Propionyl-coenzyme A carboxylase alpha polypeptide n=1 Tax=Allorhizobium terrae TaxID=1848972 RepID=A0A4S4A3P8_9HYPH|nr:hypothetical protein E6C51_04010 [Allorhizobium terrae]